MTTNHFRAGFWPSCRACHCVFRRSQSHRDTDVLYQ